MNCKKPILGGQVLENLCIKVPKVYDWITNQGDFFGVFNEGIDFVWVPVMNTSLPSPCDSQGNVTITCTLTDGTGTPIGLDEVECKEIPQPGGRESFPVTVNGTQVVLQKVKVAKQGFVTIRATDGLNSWLAAAPGTTPVVPQVFPWHMGEKFFLCAPPGTSLQCHITDFECDVLLVCPPTFSTTPGSSQLKVSINICQDIQMEALVKIEVEARFCEPRPQLPFVCPPRTFPAQCPDVFPG